MDARLIIDPPDLGAWNMAVDEWLLENAGERNEVSLRFYQWSEPTLSLGYFQSFEERHSHATSETCPVVRRATGGGAIVHDRELTYSFAVPTRAPWAKDPRALYALVHEALVEVLANQGIYAELFQRGAWQQPSSPEPFLCFERRSVGDVIYRGHKICGSAQRRRRLAFVQHGSVLLDASKAAPELPGLNDLSGQSYCSPTQLGEQISTRLGLLLELTWKKSPLSNLEQASVLAVCRARFAENGWTQKR